MARPPDPGRRRHGHATASTSRDTFDAGVASLEAHAAYLAGLGDHPMADPQEFLEAIARGSGARIGARFGVLFEVIGL